MGQHRKNWKNLTNGTRKWRMDREPVLWRTNVVNTKSFEIKTPDVSIKVAPDKTYLVENR